MEMIRSNNYRVKELLREGVYAYLLTAQCLATLANLLGTSLHESMPLWQTRGGSCQSGIVGRLYEGQMTNEIDHIDCNSLPQLA